MKFENIDIASLTMNEYDLKEFDDFNFEMIGEFLQEMDGVKDFPIWKAYQEERDRRLVENNYN